MVDVSISAVERVSSGKYAGQCQHSRDHCHTSLNHAPWRSGIRRVCSAIFAQVIHVYRALRGPEDEGIFTRGQGRKRTTTLNFWPGRPETPWEHEKVGHTGLCQNPRAVASLKRRCVIDQAKPFLPHLVPGKRVKSSDQAFSYSYPIAALRAVSAAHQEREQACFSTTLRRQSLSWLWTVLVDEHGHGSRHSRWQ